MTPKETGTVILISHHAVFMPLGKADNTLRFSRCGVLSCSKRTDEFMPQSYTFCDVVGRGEGDYQTFQNLTTKNPLKPSSQDSASTGDFISG